MTHGLQTIWRRTHSNAWVADVLSMAERRFASRIERPNGSRADDFVDGPALEPTQQLADDRLRAVSAHRCDPRCGDWYRVTVFRVPLR